MDGGQVTNSSDWTFPAFDVYLGPSAVSSIALGSSFVGNQGVGTVQVRSGALTFAANSFPGGATPNAFGPLISFGVPYTYNGGDLLMTVSYAVPDSALAFDLASGEVGFDYGQTNGYNASNVDLPLPGVALVVQFELLPVLVPETGTLSLFAFAGIAGLGIVKARRCKG